MGAASAVLGAFAALAGPAAAQAAPGDISLAAGAATPGFSGDGGPATAAQLQGPFGVAATPDGGFLVADRGNHRIRKVLNGTITTVAGNGTGGFSGDNGTATAAMLNDPIAVASTPDGGFLIADDGNHRIRKVLNGIITTVAGSGTAGFSGDNGPATSAKLGTLGAIAPTVDGGFLIADSTNHRVRKVLNGIITTVAGIGVSGSSGDGGPATSAQISFPNGVAPTFDGGFLIADIGDRIRKVLNGQITTVAGTGLSGFSGDGGPATAALIADPYGITPTADGGFLFADRGNHRIRKVLNGQITTVAGNGSSGYSGNGGPATAAALDNPTAIAPMPDGGFLIDDYFNGRIRRVEGVPTPAVLNTDPPSPADQNLLRVSGTALGTAIVALYPTADCSGAPLVSGAGSQFSTAGLPVSVPDNSTTTFHAQATQSGYTSACSGTSVTYAEVTPSVRDTKRPNSRITRIKVTGRRAKVVFNSTEKGSDFACKVDKGRFRGCRSPKTLKNLRPGRHTIRVRATDEAGNREKTPAKRTFRVRR